MVFVMVQQKEKKEEEKDEYPILDKINKKQNVEIWHCLKCKKKYDFPIPTKLNNKEDICKYCGRSY